VKLAKILETLRVPRNEIVYVHSSTDWLQRAGIRVADVLPALRDWLAPHGTLVMPGYPFLGPHLDYVRRRPSYDVRHTPARVGLLPEMFRRWPGVVRSLEPDYPVLMYGAEARTLAGASPPPADPFGAASVYRRILDRPATLLGLGVSFNTNTFIHVLDSQLEDRYPFKVYVDETYHIPLTSHDGSGWNQVRRVLRPELQTQIEPGTLVPLIGEGRELFASLKVQQTIFFRWDLAAWEHRAHEHALEQLEAGGLPCWLKRIAA
jgi:aminoglycoside N3'-acetyltransferase